jgi:hypothetical protein
MYILPGQRHLDGGTPHEAGENPADMPIMIGIWEGMILKVCLVDNHHARKYNDEKSIDSLNQETTFEYGQRTVPFQICSNSSLVLPEQGY